MEVWALTAPPALEDESEWIKIADLVLMSDLVTSTFADERMYFQHFKVSRDRNVWPDSWLEADADPVFDKDDADQIWKKGRKGGYLPPGYVWPDDREEAKTKYLETVEEFNCPFAWLLQPLS